MRIVWLDGALVDPARAALSIDDPGVRWGEGLFETMRAEGGTVPLLALHLERLRGSAATLALDGMPAPERIAEAVAEVLAAAPPGPARVRLTVTPRPTLLVELTPEAPLGAPGEVEAVSIRGAWLPGDTMAEHKALSYARHRRSMRAAAAAGADAALLLDAEGRLGEAATAGVLCRVGGRVVTAPVRGLLAGVARRVVMSALAVDEVALEERDWRAADEIVLVNAVAGAVAVVRVDDIPVGDGRAGRLARDLQGALVRALA